MKTITGEIPAFTECPHVVECGVISSCHHKGVDHEVPYVCMVAKGFEIIDYLATKNAEEMVDIIKELPRMQRIID